MLLKVSFLVEAHVTALGRAHERFFMSVHSEVRKKFTLTCKHFHAKVFLRKVLDEVAAGSVENVEL